MDYASYLDAASQLTDRELHLRLVEAAASARVATAQLIALLSELDARQLYLAEGCASMFGYCTNVLRLSESATYTRIQAARAARKWPLIIEALARGDITLTTVGLLAPHFADDNVRALIQEATHKRKHDVERIVARLRPLPDAPSVVRKLPTANAAGMATAPTCVDPAAPGGPAMTRELAGGSHDVLTATGEQSPARAREESASRHDGSRPSTTTRQLLSIATPVTVSTSPTVTSSPRPRPTQVLPLTPERYKIQITVDRDTHDCLREAQRLMRHMVPDGDPAAVIARALRVLVEDLLRRKAALASREGWSPGMHKGSRAIPARVRRAVWLRDKGRCQFEGLHGRCDSPDFIEFHHVVPFARGGKSTVDNLELRCRAHNAYEARLVGLDRPERRAPA